MQPASGILLHTLGRLYLNLSTVWIESETTVLLINSHTDSLILKSNCYRDEPLDKCWPIVWLFNPLLQIHCSFIASIQQMANEIDKMFKQSCGILISLQSVYLEYALDLERLLIFLEPVKNWKKNVMSICSDFKMNIFWLYFYFFYMPWRVTDFGCLCSKLTYSVTVILPQEPLKPSNKPSCPQFKKLPRSCS